MTTLADTTEAAERLALTLAKGRPAEGDGAGDGGVPVRRRQQRHRTRTRRAARHQFRGGIGRDQMLSTVGLIERVPAPGSHREHYRLREGAWVTLMSAQNSMVQAMFEAADQGIKASGDDSPAARRLTEMRDFYGFMFRELPALVDRWRADRASGPPDD
jgi:hypothetical protein